MKRKLAEFVFFNYIGAIAAALGPLLVVPVYLSELGKAQWGLMSVVLTIVALLIMVDGGLSQVLLREFSLLARTHGRFSPPLRLLWRSSQLLYAALAGIFGSALAVFGKWIAWHWLNLGSGIDLDEATRVLVLSGLLVAVQLFAALPRSLLLALDLYRPLNISIALAHALRFGIGAIVVFWTHSLQWLLIWYIVVALAEGSVRHAMAQRAIAMRESRERPSWTEIRRLLPGSTAMSFAVVLSGITTQLDKLILSKMVVVEQVGIYVIASSVALGLLSLTYPLIQAVFPALIAVREDKLRTRKIFLNWLALAATGAIMAMALYVGAGRAILNLWLRNSDVAAAVYPVLFVLLIGTLLNVIYQVGYIGWMLDANYRMPLVISAISMGLTFLIAPTLIRQYGIVGAAAGWLSINAVGLVFSLSWFKRIL